MTKITDIYVVQSYLTQTKYILMKNWKLSYFSIVFVQRIRTKCYFRKKKSSLKIKAVRQNFTHSSRSWYSLGDIIVSYILNWIKLKVLLARVVKVK